MWQEAVLIFTCPLVAMLFINFTSELDLPPKGLRAYGMGGYRSPPPYPAGGRGKIPERGFYRVGWPSACWRPLLDFLLFVFFVFVAALALIFFFLNKNSLYYVLSRTQMTISEKDPQ